MKAKQGMFAMWMGMLQKFGGAFEPVKSDPETKREKVWLPRFRAMLRAPQPHIYRTEHGSLIRNRPKRDKSISARQWKKRVKRERRERVIAEV